MDPSCMQAILDRRSIRSYRPDPVTDDQVDLLVAAAMASPSAVNHQPWHFSFVRNAGLIGEISQSALEALGRDPNFHIFYHAPLVVFISADTSRKWGVLDSGIAVQNLALAAHAMGLGSVIVGMADPAFEAAGGLGFARRLEFPEGHKLAITIAIGHPAGTKPPHENHADRVSRID